MAAMMATIAAPDVLAEENARVSGAKEQQTPQQRDGQHDFDFEIGTWHTQLSRLVNALSGSTTWAKYEGTTVVRKVWGGLANGRGEFYSQETLNGRAILVRFVISDITPDSCHFEQAFSDDGGKTWEVNWIAVDTRVKGAAAQ